MAESDSKQSSSGESAPQTDPGLRTIAMPADTNPHGDIFGGWLLRQMDLAGTIIATRRACGRVVTVAVTAMEFKRPVMVGDELLRYLRRKGFADLPVIIMTAGLHPEIYLSQGANDVLPKPFDMEVLLDKVARYMPPADRTQALG